MSISSSDDMGTMMGDEPAGPAIARGERIMGLRTPFDPKVVGKLPKISCGACSKSGSKVCDRHNKSKCSECGNYITNAHVHLDYVGHAAVTDRLLAVDPFWTWEPLAFDPATGLPKIVEFDGKARLWIRLTVLHHARIGVGIVDTGGFRELEKELIGDAIRNAAMRFGVALDLWSKEDLSPSDEADEGGPEAGAGNDSPTTPPSPAGGSESEDRQRPPEGAVGTSARPAQLRELRLRITTLEVADAAVAQAIERLYGVEKLARLSESQAADLIGRLNDDNGATVRRLRELTGGGGDAA